MYISKTPDPFAFANLDHLGNIRQALADGASATSWTQASKDKVFTDHELYLLYQFRYFPVPGSLIPYYLRTDLRLNDISVSWDQALTET